MATYVYRCGKCGERFECIESIAEHDSAKPKCPKCGAGHVQQVMAPVFAKTSKKS